MPGNTDVKFIAFALFDDSFSVSVDFKLSSSDGTAVLSFTNLNESFSLAKFSEVLCVDGIEGIPIISTIMQVSIESAQISMAKPTENSAISIVQGQISLYAESIAIMSGISLKQVKVLLYFTKDTIAPTYKYSFQFCYNLFELCC